LERGSRFLWDVRAFVSAGDEVGLHRRLQLRWSLAVLTGFLNGADAEVRCTAAFCLGVLGGRGAVLPLVGALRADDARLAGVAEDALWRSWFGAAGHAARGRLMRAVDLIEEGRHDAAEAVLDSLIEGEPEFAEAYHQRGIVRYLRGVLWAALEDYERAARLEPCHFGAMAGSGRVHADLGQPLEALAAYRRALRVHPRMSGVRESMRAVRATYQT